MPSTLTKRVDRRRGVLGFQRIQRVLQIRRVARLDGRPHMGARMAEFQLHRMQPLAFEPQFLRYHRVRPVHRVSYQRMPDGREVDADLVGSSGFEVDFHQCGFAEAFEYIPMGDRFLAGGGHREAEIGDFRPPDWRFDGRLVFLEIALDERMIGFHDFMFGELPAHLLVGEI